jgi:hypothetical protein
MSKKKTQSELDKLMESQQDVSHNQKSPIPAHPQGWEPGVSFNHSKKKGTITSRPTTNSSPEFSDLLEEWGFNPDNYMILDNTLQVRTWDMNMGGGNIQQAWYYRATVIANDIAITDKDYERLLKWIQSHKRKPKPKMKDPKRSFFVAISDLQLGKRDGGGTEAIIERFLDKIDKVKERYEFLQKAGMQFDQLTIVGLGDIVEGCVGFYPDQTFSVELDNRSQIKVARKLIAKAIVEWSKDFPLVVVGAVPGNHGTKRISKGVAPTGEMDNADLEVFEQLGEIFAQNKTYQHVKFIIPDDPHLTFNICGTVCSFTHGHAIGMGGGTPEVKVMKWWKDQAFGWQHPGDSKILVSGHYHHYIHKTDPRNWFQVPSLDESTWFKNQTGKQTQQGIFTMSIEGTERGYSNAEIV